MFFDRVVVLSGGFENDIGSSGRGCALHAAPASAMTPTIAGKYVESIYTATFSPTKGTVTIDGFDDGGDIEIFHRTRSIQERGERAERTCLGRPAWHSGARLSPQRKNSTAARAIP